MFSGLFEIFGFLLLVKFYILAIYILTITFSDSTSINSVYCNYELCEPVIHNFAFIPPDVCWSCHLQQ